MTERITAGKYPAYAAYQQTTSRLMPWFPGPALHGGKGREFVQASVGEGAGNKKTR